MEIEGATFNISSSLVMKICLGDDCVPTLTLCGPERLFIAPEVEKNLQKNQNPFFCH
ncbi:hypothetical protein DPMN_031830 [Dreissena polymorpha]|uniref:Uncharacterized protein n=1 Tax=Dreissena polymorpha TaxID=45954 RepID=A0A9D4RHP1_DREPO|nr:hypothetical protein DPMN_031830 [Dreissena polymorpha]